MKKITRLALFVFLLSTFGFLNAQVGINNDNSDPDASAMLDVKSSDKGMLVPRLTMEQRTIINSPAQGLLVYQTDTLDGFYYYNGLDWIALDNLDEDWTIGNGIVYNTSDKIGIGVDSIGNQSFVVGDDNAFALFLRNDNLDNNRTPFSSVLTQTFTATKDAILSRVRIGLANRTDTLLFELGRGDNPNTGEILYTKTLKTNGNRAGSKININIDSTIELTVGEVYFITLQDINQTPEFFNLARGMEYEGGSLWTGRYSEVPNQDLVFELFEDRFAILAISNDGKVGIGTGNPIVDVDINGLTHFNSKVGIGTSIPDEVLHIVGNLKIEDGNQQNGYVLTSDANGVGTWQINPGMNTDEQTLSFNTNNNVLSITDGNSVTLSSINTDDQTLSFDGTSISISDGNSIDISGVGDQTLSFDGTNISISDGNSIDISGVDDQTLSFDDSNNNLSIADGNSIDISGVDDQTLSFDNSNNTLSIVDGNSVSLSSLSDGVPIGTIIMWPSETLPTGWIPCNGQPFVRSTYPELFDILGDTGDGTANVPNFRGRFPLGVGQSQTTYSTNHAIKSTGGFEKHKLTINEMPAHTHGIQYREGEEQGSGNDYSDLGDTGVNDSTQSTGGSQEHNNMPPFYTINFIIKAE